MVCEILCVGTEILLGEIVNTDGAFVAREIAALGFSSYHQTIVGDNEQRLREALRTALERSDVVITTGGLGPTLDDITKATIADALGIPMYLNEEILNDVRAFYTKRGLEMTDNNIQQAMIPEEAEVMRVYLKGMTIFPDVSMTPFVPSDSPSTHSPSTKGSA